MKNVALIAIAKDESPYLHEWIHHHLYLGFGKILIGVNRTTDSSFEILNKIKRNHQTVFIEKLDWIDKGTKEDFKGFQPLAYAYLSSKLDNEETSHVCFLDIDEFWFSNVGNSINDFIKSSPYFDIASFPWFAQRGEEKSFNEPFKNVLMKINKNVKSLVRLDALDKCKLIRPHVPSFSLSEYKKLVHIDQNGEVITPEQQGNINSEVLNLNFADVCKQGVLHRMVRSEEEYLSLLLRGNPNGKIIKNNGRNGFIYESEEMDNPFGDEYYSSLNSFIMNNDLSEGIAKARKEKLLFYKKRIDSMSVDELVGEYESAYKAFKKKSTLKYFVEAFSIKVIEPNILRDFALLIEKNHTELALILMNSAKTYRPNGPLINKKIQIYKGKLSLI